MTWTMLLREAWLSTRTRLTPVFMIAILCASMCATTLLTVGQSASAEAEVMARMDQAGSRQLVVNDRYSNGLLNDTVIESIAAIDIVERAVGFTVAQDMRSGHVPLGGHQVPAWGVVGDVRDVVTLIDGRAPEPGEAVVSATAVELLAFDGPSGYLVQGLREIPVVGTFAVRAPFADMADGIIVAAPEGTTAREIHVIADSASNMSVVQQQTLFAISADRPEDISVRSPVALAELQDAVAADLGQFGRQLILLVLGAGGAITAVVVLADVLLRRADLGRRRALGATRTTLVALVLIRTAIAATAGVALGIGAALAATRNWAVGIPTEFIVGTGVLTLLAAVFAAIGPAAIAATRDPVSVLRTP